MHMSAGSESFCFVHEQGLKKESSSPTSFENAHALLTHLCVVYEVHARGQLCSQGPLLLSPGSDSGNDVGVRNNEKMES